MYEIIRVDRFGNAELIQVESEKLDATLKCFEMLKSKSVKFRRIK